jgi:hypothetical protein
MQKVTIEISDAALFAAANKKAESDVRTDLEFSGEVLRNIVNDTIVSYKSSMGLD